MIGKNMAILALAAAVNSHRQVQRRCERKARTGTLVDVKEVPQRIGRNAPCPCGSGKKLKNCHYNQVVRGHEVRAGE